MDTPTAVGKDFTLMSYWLPYRRSTRTWIVAAAGVGFGLTVVLFLIGSRGVEFAGILAVPIGLGSFLAAIVGVLPRKSPVRIARDLGRRVELERAEALRRSVSDQGDTKPADVGFRRPDGSIEPNLVRWRGDGGAAAGTMRDVSGYYRSLQRGRLVVLGDPGAGKTVLATQLVLDLIRQLPTANPEPDSGERLVIPVLLSLPSFGQWLDPDTDDPDQAAARLDEWIARTLDETYGIARPMARRLIFEGWILPVLDGLDEMDAAGQEPAKARATIAATNGMGRRPVVLISRRTDYLRITNGTGTRAVGVHDAQAIIIEPLTARQISEYLTYRFADPEVPTRVEPRWSTVCAGLATAPRASELAGLLGNPWHMFLFVTAYQDPGTDPNDLLAIDPANRITHLLAAFVPSLVRDHQPRFGGRVPHPDQMVTWLATLAHHLESTHRRHGWPSTDLHLDRMWPIGGWITARLAASLLGLLMITPFLTLMIFIIRGTTTATGTALGVGFVVMVAASVLASPWSIRAEAPERASLRQLRTPSGRRKLAISLAAGAAVAAPLGYLDGSPLPGPFFAASIVLLSLATGAIFGMSENIGSIDRPSGLLRQSVAFETIRAVLLGVVFGTLSGMGVSATSTTSAGVFAGLYLGVQTTLWALAPSRWPRYWAAMQIARSKSLLPRRPAHFLDWAYSCGILRLSGISLQFRHSELQRWLAGRR